MSIIYAWLLGPGRNAKCRSLTAHKQRLTCRLTRISYLFLTPGVLTAEIGCPSSRRRRASELILPGGSTTMTGTVRRTFGMDPIEIGRANPAFGFFVFPSLRPEIGAPPVANPIEEWVSPPERRPTTGIRTRRRGERAHR